MVKSILVLPNNQEIKINRLAGDYLPPVATVGYIYWDTKDAVVMHSKEDEVYSIIENIDLGGAV
jgi:spermidine/putrescine transport system ATP-binding protein